MSRPLPKDGPPGNGPEQGAQPAGHVRGEREPFGRGEVLEYLDEFGVGVVGKGDAFREP
ncbi:hypothetical protein [Actinomadura darangshiensis]|uniref:hypothetical protein n=1 Tax=Actinomadura darangshiensis TaxID=705336 RepID=UPI00140CB794|nr:hypothetical protein [Actinomadura darangshiensis]